MYKLILAGVFLINSVYACLPECHPDYDEWLSVGAPESWCIPRQCRGDADGQSTGSKFQGYAYVNSLDLALLMSTWAVKEPPEGPGLSTADMAVDFDHRASGSPYVGYHRIGTNDYCIFLEYFDIKEPPEGPGVPECDVLCPIEDSVIDGPQLSLRVKTDSVWQDVSEIFVTPQTDLEIGIVNDSGDKCTCYDGYISITDGVGNGLWTGTSWVYNPTYFRWTYFGTSPLAGQDTWYLETLSPTDSGDPAAGGVSASATYETGAGDVVVTLYNEFFEPVDILDVRVECLSPSSADYADWVAFGQPDCWCYERQCNGDWDGASVGSKLKGFAYVNTSDLSGGLLSQWNIKEPPHGPGVYDICADFDHKAVGNKLKGFVRVETGDLNRLLASWNVKEPTKGPGVPLCPLTTDEPAGDILYYKYPYNP